MQAPTVEDFSFQFDHQANTSLEDIVEARNQTVVNLQHRKTGFQKMASAILL